MSGALVVPNATGTNQALNADSADTRYVNLTGDTMTGTLNIGTAVKLGADGSIVATGGSASSGKVSILNNTTFGGYVSAADATGANPTNYLAGRIGFSSSAFLVVDSSTVGVRLNSGATAWAAQSDERLKTDLTPIKDGLNKVGLLRAVTGRYKTDKEGTSRAFLIAQDVQAVLPEAVDEDSDGDNTLSLRYSESIPLLVSALHDAKDRIEALEAANAALEARITTLEAN
jgi:hypothetical protein